MRRRTIGYVFQDFNLLAGLTAVENVSLPLELDGLSAKKAYAIGSTALEELGLADRATHYPDELSGGERQRVSIARAVVGERRLFFFQLRLQLRGQPLLCYQDAGRVVFLRDGRVVDQTFPPPSPESFLEESAQPSPRR